METIGIIAEYNPFHRGHAHQLSYLAKHWPKAVRIVVMSGSFVQRGGPALFSKFDRARWAILGGADVVIELPTLWASANAEAFADGGVRLLAGLGVECLSFGSEITDLDLLKQTASLNQEEDVQKRIKDLLKEGLFYGAALRQAMVESLPQASKILESPNAMLGVEYLRTIKAYGLTMIPLPVERQSNHHAHQLTEALPSGTALRAELLRNSAKSKHQTSILSALSPYFPQKVFPLINQALQEGRYAQPERYQEYIHYRGRIEEIDTLQNLQDFTEGLEHKWMKAMQANTWAQAREQIKSKRYSYARLDRMAANTVLGITKGLYQEGQKQGPNYARLLAFNQRGRNWLRSYRGTLPIIQKWAPFFKKASGFTKASLRLDQKATDIQALAMAHTNHHRGGLDYTMPPIYLP